MAIDAQVSDVAPGHLVSLLTLSLRNIYCALVKLPKNEYNEFVFGKLVYVVEILTTFASLKACKRGKFCSCLFFRNIMLHAKY